MRLRPESYSPIAQAKSMWFELDLLLGDELLEPSAMHVWHAHSRELQSLSN